MSFVTDTTSAEAKDLDPAVHEDRVEDADLEEANVDDVDDEEDEEDEEEAEDEEEDEEDAEAPSNGAGKATADLFRESEIAADYVEGLLDILDYDGDIDEL